MNSVRASLANGFIVHAGATSMELYHEHPHLPKEEVVQPEDISLQTRLVMRNHKEILDWLGLGWRNIVKLTCYQKRMNESKEIQAVLASYFKDWRPAITAVQIDGLSSPQARLEIDMWVRPDTPIVAAGARTCHGTGRALSATGSDEPRQRTLWESRSAVIWICSSFRVSRPIHLKSIRGTPVTFKMPADAKTQGKMATDNLDSVLKAAGITPQHILLGQSYTAEAGAGPSFGARSGNWRSPGTALQVVDTGIPGAKALRRAHRGCSAQDRGTQGPGSRNRTHPSRADIALKDMPVAPAISVSTAVDLVFFSGITVYPPDVDPWNPGTFTAPQDVETQEKMLTDEIDRALKAAGITWQHVILIERVGEAASGNYLKQKLGDWRPCRVTRVLSTGVPGAKVMYEITAVAPRKA